MNLQIASFDTIFYMFFQSGKTWWNPRIWAFFAGRIIFITFFFCLFFWLSCTSTHIFGLNSIYTLDENLFYQEWDLTCIRVLKKKRLKFAEILRKKRLVLEKKCFFFNFLSIFEKKKQKTIPLFWGIWVGTKKFTITYTPFFFSGKSTDGTVGDIYHGTKIDPLGMCQIWIFEFVSDSNFFHYTSTLYTTLNFIFFLF